MLQAEPRLKVGTLAGWLLSPAKSDASYPFEFFSSAHGLQTDSPPGVWMIDDEELKADFQEEWIPKFLSSLWKVGTMEDNDYDASLKALISNTEGFNTTLDWIKSVGSVQLDAGLLVLRSGFQDPDEVDISVQSRVEDVRTAISNITDKNRSNMFGTYFTSKQYPLLKAAVANSKKWVACRDGDADRVKVIEEAAGELRELPALEESWPELGASAVDMCKATEKHAAMLRHIHAQDAKSSKQLRRIMKDTFQMVENVGTRIVDRIFDNGRQVFTRCIHDACGERYIKSADLVVPALTAGCQTFPGKIGNSETTGMKNANLVLPRNILYDTHALHYTEFISNLLDFFREMDASSVKSGPSLKCDKAVQYFGTYFSDGGAAQPAEIVNRDRNIADVGFDLSEVCIVIGEIFTLLHPRETTSPVLTMLCLTTICIPG